VKSKLRIGIQLRSTRTFDIQKPGNVQGDEQVALSWQKYLQRRADVELVSVYGPNDRPRDDLDVVIHFYPMLDLHPSAKNFFYLQNVFPEEHYPGAGGTVGVFRQAQSRYDGYIFTSETLMRACAPGAVIPFATDPETFLPMPSKEYAHRVCFVGNNIRGIAVNQRYLAPAVPFGLVIYGNSWVAPLADVCRGKLPMEDLPKVYSSALIHLNCHIEEHVVHDTVNLRVYDILACGGFLISDRVKSLTEIFGESAALTEGDEDLWAKLVRYLADPEERKRRAAIGRKIVLSDHTYKQRIEKLMGYLRETL
jgi:spore maturation protein CgeB